jgi:hypothetical protein
MLSDLIIAADAEGVVARIRPLVRQNEQLPVLFGHFLLTFWSLFGHFFGHFRSQK